MRQRLRLPSSTQQNPAVGIIAGSPTAFSAKAPWRGLSGRFGGVGRAIGIGSGPTHGAGGTSASRGPWIPGHTLRSTWPAPSDVNGSVLSRSLWSLESINGTGTASRCAAANRGNGNPHRRARWRESNGAATRRTNTATSNHSIGQRKARTG